ncbi:MAG: ATP-binding protein [Lachnospiraceae bacterium]|nr:ATP-binding protein [Lachnospiraceae bacterium]
MMPEISLNILDVAENSVRAGADHITIDISADTAADQLTVQIIDNGCGMDAEQVAHVIDPFYTTRTTRRVGLGVPFFKLAAELSGGNFGIDSVKGEGTTVKAVFGLSNVDRMPLGDIGGTMLTLITMHEEIRFTYRFEYDGSGFDLDTAELREVLGDDISFKEAEVSAYISEYLSENTAEILNGRTI